MLQCKDNSIKLTAVFRSSCFFNCLLHCRAPTIIQKTFGEVWRSVSKICSLHCGASTGHRLVSTMAWYFAWVEYARGSLVPCQRNFFLVKEIHDSILEFRFLHCKITCRTLGVFLLHGNHVQHILRVDARNKLGTRNWTCFAGTRLWAIGKLFWRSVRDACRLYRIWHFLLYIFFSFPPPPLHWARLRALGLTWLDLLLTSKLCQALANYMVQWFLRFFQVHFCLP